MCYDEAGSSHGDSESDAKLMVLFRRPHASGEEADVEEKKQRTDNYQSQHAYVCSRLTDPSYPVFFHSLLCLKQWQEGIVESSVSKNRLDQEVYVENGHWDANERHAEGECEEQYL